MGRKYASERKIPHLDETRHAQPDVPPHRSRKDTKRWCRGKVGVEHQPDVRFAHRAERYLRWHGARCLWWPYGNLGWSCGHERFCAECGKVLERDLGRDCPDFHYLR